MSQGRIRKAFNDIVRGYGTSKGYPVVLENTDATPPLTSPYLKTFLLPASTSSNTMGGDHKRYIGVYQVTIVVPAGEGTGRVTTIVDELQALFPIFGHITYNTTPVQKVVVMTPIETLNGSVSDGAFYTPISFEYRSDIN